MDQLMVKFVGIGALLIHNNRGANPLSRYTTKMKPLTSKRNKTDKDYAAISRLEWEAGLYLNSDGVVALPAKCIDKCCLEGARKSSNGKKYESGVVLDGDFFELSYSGPTIRCNPKCDEIPNPQLDRFYLKHSDQQLVKVSKNQVLRTRPIFHNWSCIVSFLYAEETIDRRTLISCIEDAGRLVGLCEQRPRMGRFNVEEIS